LRAWDGTGTSRFFAMGRSHDAQRFFTSYNR
jgi:hypothetical protein